MRVSSPVSVSVPAGGVRFAESIHSSNFPRQERLDPFHKVIFVLSGKVAFRQLPAKTDSLIEAGSVVLVAARTPHQLTDQTPSTLLLMCLHPDFLRSESELAALWQSLLKMKPPLLVLSRPSRARLSNMWRRAILERTHGQLGSGVTERSLAAQTIVLLARLPPHGDGDNAPARVTAVAQEIAETFYDEWNLDRAARRSALSRRRFSHLFRTELGQTFWDYLQRLRLGHAAKLLAAGDHSVAGVAFSSGFGDLSHFYRVFRQTHGLPPKRWLLAQTTKKGLK